MVMPTVEVLLATYNGGDFLRDQLDSVLAQTGVRVRVSARDGGSADNSPEILAEYARRYPEALRVLPGGRADARTNFAALLDAATGDWLAFCDQDDVWYPDKLDRTLQTARAAGGDAKADADGGEGDVPVLAFTDARVVDAAGKPLAASAMARQGLDPARNELRHLVTQNMASGHTMLFNRALASLARPIPPEAVMHDHWLALVAALFGRAAHLPAATLDYRQHGENIFGAPYFSWGYFLRRARLGPRRLRERIHANTRQAGALLERFGAMVSPADRELLADFARLPAAGWWERRRILWRHGIAKTGWRRNLGTWIIV